MITENAANSLLLGNDFAAAVMLSEFFNTRLIPCDVLF